MNQSTEVHGNIHSKKKGYKYIVITKCDLILHEYYITRRHKSKIVRYEKSGRSSRVTKRGFRELVKRRKAD